MPSRLKTKVFQFVNPFIRLPTMGLDISDRTIKYLRFLQVKDKIRFDLFGEIEIPEGIIINGEIQKEADLVKIFSGWLAREGRKTRSSFMVVSLPEEKSYVRLLQLPKIKREDIRGAIRWEIEANIPVPIDELIYDYEIIEQSVAWNEDHIDVLVTAFPKKIVESYVRVLKSAGIRISAMELESQAIIRAVRRRHADNLVRAVADVGRNKIGLTIISAGAIVFTTTVDLGGNTFDTNISRALDISLEEAVKIKMEIGLKKTAYEGKIWGALAPALSVFADQIRRASEYYQGYVEHAHNAEIKVAEVILTGGNANLDGLEMHLSSILKIPVRRGNPFESFGEKMIPAIPPMPKNKSLAYSTAIGLALRGII